MEYPYWVLRRRIYTNDLLREIQDPGATYRYRKKPHAFVFRTGTFSPVLRILADCATSQEGHS